MNHINSSKWTSFIWGDRGWNFQLFGEWHLLTGSVCSGRNPYWLFQLYHEDHILLNNVITDYGFGSEFELTYLDKSSFDGVVKDCILHFCVLAWYIRFCMFFLKYFFHSCTVDFLMVFKLQNVGVVADAGALWLIHWSLILGFREEFWY